MPQENTQEPNGDTIERDTKWCWLVNMCSSLANIIVLGSLFSYTILFPKIIDEFQQGKAKSALVVSIGLSLHSVGAPVSAKLCILFGCRIIMVCGGVAGALGLLASSFAPNLYVLYLTYGVVVGYATSMVYNAGYQIIPLYFKKHCFLASSLASMGFGAGYFVMCPILQLLLDHLGDWRKSLLVMAGINMIPVILGCSITRRATSTETSNGSPSTTRCCNWVKAMDLSVFKNPVFVILTVSLMTLAMGHYMVYMHLAKYAEDIGLAGQQASQLYVISGGTSLVSRLLTAKVCDTGWVSALRIYQGGAVILAIVTVILPLENSFGFLVMYCVFMGVAEGMYVITIYSHMNNTYPGVGFGWFLCSVVVPYLTGPPLAGFIADQSGSYHPVFYTAGGILLLSAIIMELRKCTRSKKYTLKPIDTKANKEKKPNLHQESTQDNPQATFKELQFSELEQNSRSV